jgi:excisionase family DNA binding protein
MIAPRLRPERAPELPEPDSGMPGRPAPDPPAERLAYSVDEAARLTGLSRDLLYDEMRRGNLPYVKVGRRRLITRQHLQQFLGVAS